jgi:hypothetical protein
MSAAMVVSPIARQLDVAERRITNNPGP